MQFIPPYDQIGISPPGPWTNASPAAGVKGSIVNADVFPAVQYEIVNALIAAGLTPTSTSFTQLTQAIGVLGGTAAPNGGLTKSGNGLLLAFLNLLADSRSTPVAGDLIALERMADGATVSVSAAALASYVLSNIVQTGTFQQIVNSPVLHVNPQGSDSNPGTASSPLKTNAGAFAAAQKLNFATSMLTIEQDLGGQGSADFDLPPNVASIPGQIVILGDANNPGNYRLNPASGAGVGCISMAQSLTFRGVSIPNPGGLVDLVSSGGRIVVDHVAFTAPNGRAASLQANPTGAITIQDGCSWSGNSSSLGFANGGTIGAGNNQGAAAVTITLINNPSFSAAVFVVGSLSSVDLLSTLAWSGTATGAQWIIGKFGIMSTGGRTGAFVPGQSSGNVDQSGGGLS